MLPTPTANFPVKLYVASIVPIVFLLVSLLMRHNAGPFWLWSNLDPDYAYLFDSLNMVNGKWPQEMAHPGITVDFIGAIIIRIIHPITSLQEINQLVLINPEHYLLILSRIFIFINTIALLILGIVGLIVFQDWVPSLFLQMGPFLSKLAFKWSLHVAPEPLLITTVIALSILIVLGLRDGQLEKYSTRYAIAFGLICGFGIATKLTSAGIYLLPVLFLGKVRAIIIFFGATIFATAFFSLPGAGSLSLVLDQVISISSATGHHGHGPPGFIDTSSYLRNLIRVSSRPVFFVVLLLGISSVILTRINSPKIAATPTYRALCGLCLCFFCQALLVAKHPAGHYMIPALVLSSLGLVLIYDLLRRSVFLFDKSRLFLRKFSVAFLVFLVISQIISLNKLNEQFSRRSLDSARLDETRYMDCAKIFVWPASNPMYGLFFGRWNTKGSFGEELRTLFQEKSSMYMINDGKLHDLYGTRSLRELPGEFPCVYMRGQSPEYSLKLLEPALENFAKMNRCELGEEKIVTWGIKCAPDK